MDESLTSATSYVCDKCGQFVNVFNGQDWHICTGGQPANYAIKYDPNAATLAEISKKLDDLIVLLKEHKVI